MNNFIILGGGAAGWITALFLRKLLPIADITLIQSKEIGIIGVGEATTPHVISFLQDHDLDPLEVIKETNGTIKNGINFVNWNGDGSSYFHDFYNPIVNFSVENFFPHSCDDFFKQFLINNNLPFEEYIYQQKLSYNNKIDLVNTKYALHFDSVKFADYLEKIGKSRNIKIINDNLATPVLNENGFIESLQLESGRNLKCDFVFDCSGFARLLIGKLYKSSWHSYNSFLPAKQAIPFWLEKTSNYKPYTDSIAMKNGWMWNIPLQHRVGAGYVFDSDYISADEAKLEVEGCIGQEIEIRKVISFDPGRFHDVWIKNCLAVGLSGNFLEPLESTSLWLSIMQLNQFKIFMNELDNPNQSSQNLYNKIFRKSVDTGANFIHFHYLTKRNDSKFWQEFKTKNKTPNEVKEIMSLIDSTSLRSVDIASYQTFLSFQYHSWLVVAKGLGMINKNFNLTFFERLFPSHIDYKNQIDQLYHNAPYHKSLIEHLQKG